MKIETYLRMANLPYQIVKVSDPSKAPKGKLPYIEEDGTIVADSGCIIHYLKEKYNDSLDASLTELQKAEGVALQRLLEEHLYWIVLYSRWIDAANWPTTKGAFFAKAPALTRGLISTLIQRKMQKALYAQGVGRHQPDEIYQLGIEDLAVLNTFLNNHTFLLRDVPTSIDAAGYAFIANILEAPISSPLKEYVSSQKNFSEYCREMKKKFYES